MFVFVGALGIGTKQKKNQKITERVVGRQRRAVSYFVSSAAVWSTGVYLSAAGVAER